MSNIEIDAPLVNGDLMPIHEMGDSCRLAVQALIGDDFGAPPRSLNLKINTKSGRTIKLVIPYDHNGTATVLIDGEAI